jgi:hypothetical protein
MVSDEKSTVGLIDDLLYRRSCFCLVAFKIPCLTLGFRNFTTVCPSMGVFEVILLGRR